MADRTNFDKAEHLGYDAGKGVKRVSVFNDGVQTNVATEAKQDPLVKYKPADLDDDLTTSGYNYYGYVDSDGNYYILREDLDNKAYRYYAGTGDYTTKWTNRAAQSYDYLFNVTIN